MTEMQTPVAAPGGREFTQLRQLTVVTDEEMANVNELLADGWWLVHIGQRSDATVYVLGRADEKPRHRAGFLVAE